ASGDWSLADAVRVAELIGAQNARRVYRLACRAPGEAGAIPDERPGEPGHNRLNPSPRPSGQGLLTIAYTPGLLREETAAWEHRQSSYAKYGRVHGPRPQLFLRLAQPGPRLPDVVPGLFPGPAVH